MRSRERGERKVPRTSETRVQFSTHLLFPEVFLSYVLFQVL